MTTSTDTTRRILPVPSELEVAHRELSAAMEECKANPTRANGQAVIEAQRRVHEIEDAYRTAYKLLLAHVAARQFKKYGVRQR